MNKINLSNVHIENVLHVIVFLSCQNDEWIFLCNELHLISSCPHILMVCTRESDICILSENIKCKIKENTLHYSEQICATSWSQISTNFHVGCSSGYNLNTYKTSTASKRNHQVNEQANQCWFTTYPEPVRIHVPQNFMDTISLIKNLDAFKKLR